jgi:hypothetical protein
MVAFACNREIKGLKAQSARFLYLAFFLAPKRASRFGDPNGGKESKKEKKISVV